MNAVWLLGHKTLSDPLSVQEALSGIFGSISLATWIFLLVSGGVLIMEELRIYLSWVVLTVVQVPQLYLNYKTGSAEGISLAFLGVWLIGDITNLSGMSGWHVSR